MSLFLEKMAGEQRFLKWRLLYLAHYNSPNCYPDLSGNFYFKLTRSFGHAKESTHEFPESFSKVAWKIKKKQAV